MMLSQKYTHLYLCKALIIYKLNKNKQNLGKNKSKNLSFNLLPYFVPYMIQKHFLLENHSFHLKRNTKKLLVEMLYWLIAKVIIWNITGKNPNMHLEFFHTLCIQQAIHNVICLGVWMILIHAMLGYYLSKTRGTVNF